MVHIHTAFHKYHPIIQSSPCFPFCPLPLYDKLPLLLTWKSFFSWSWCESLPTLVPGWWSTAHPLLPILPLPSQRLPQFMLHVFQRRYHNVSHTVWYTNFPLYTNNGIWNRLEKTFIGFQIALSKLWQRRTADSASQGSSRRPMAQSSSTMFQETEHWKQHKIQ